MVDFDSHVAQMPARRFMEVMRACWNVRVLVVGYDHRFGHNRSEGFEDYVRYGRELGIDVLPARGYPCQVGGQRICSSYVRRLLHEGQVELAAQCLGRPYLLAGTVVEAIVWAIPLVFLQPTCARATRTRLCRPTACMPCVPCWTGRSTEACRA